MPYVITIDRGIARVVLEGDLTNATLAELLEENRLWEIRLGRVPDRITDMTRVTGAQIDYLGMIDFVNRRKSDHMANKFRSALVADKPVALGYARMFQTLMDHPQATIRVFATMQEAEAWLAEEPPA